MDSWRCVHAGLPKLVVNGWMARIGLEAFAVFICLRICWWSDAGRLIDAAVVAMGFDRLRDQQNRDAEQAETACSPSRERELLVVVECRL